MVYKFGLDLKYTSYMCVNVHCITKTAMQLYLSSEKHYENTPIQVYRKFHLQKLKIFR